VPADGDPLLNSQSIEELAGLQPSLSLAERAAASGCEPRQLELFEQQRQGRFHA